MSPTYTKAELVDILERALSALEDGRRDHIYRRPHEPWHLARDLERLNACCPKFTINTEDDYWGIIVDCLEIALQSPEETYKPPQHNICTHQEAKDHIMYAFVVQLSDFTRRIYTKFCLKELTDGTWYISIDCHT